MLADVALVRFIEFLNIRRRHHQPPRVENELYELLFVEYQSPQEPRVGIFTRVRFVLTISISKLQSGLTYEFEPYTADFVRLVSKRIHFVLVAVSRGCQTLEVCVYYER